MEYTEYLPPVFILEELCGITMLITILVVLTGFVLKRRKWNSYMEGFGGQFQDHERAGFVKKIKGGIMWNMAATMLMLVVLFSVFLLTIAFVNSIIGRWVWVVFLLLAIAILGIQMYMIFSLKKLKDLDEEKYGYIHSFVKAISEKFELRMPNLKHEENPTMNAYTTSFFGRGSVIVITDGLLDRVETGRMEKEQLTAIVGHELGHIVNNDATVITIFNPMMMFTLAVRGFFEIIVRAILFLMVTVGQFGKRSIIGLLIAVVLMLFLVVILIYVGFYYVTFYILTMAVVLSWYLLSRQKEYAADLFGSLVSGSQYSMGLSLMELVRESGLDEIKGYMTKKIIEERIEKAKGQAPEEEAPKAVVPIAEVIIEAGENLDGEVSSVVEQTGTNEDPGTPEEETEAVEQPEAVAAHDIPEEKAEEQPEVQEDPETPEKKVEEQPGSKGGLDKTDGQEKDLQPGQLTQEEKMEIFNSIDIYQAVADDPELYEQISMRDAKVLCQTKGLAGFDKDDFNEFGKFEYTSREKMGELMMSHPMFGKRVKDLTQISLTQAEGTKDSPSPEKE